MKKTVIKNIIVLFVLPLAGLLLMIAVHLLPVKRIQTNINVSRNSLISEFEDELVVDDYPASLSGSFTDCLMLEFAAYDSPHSLMEQVMGMYRPESSTNENEWWPGASLIDYLDGVSTSREEEYSRYWHGYLVILKPLLSYTSFNTIRLLNASLQLILLSLILILCTKKRHSMLALSFAASMPFMFFFSSFSSLSLSVCLYIMFIGILAETIFDEKLSQNNNYITYFIVMGAATSYFDFLTYPLVTFAFPMCVYLFIHREKISEQFKKILCFGISWSLGYAFMWSSKWFLSFIFAGNGTVKDALETVKARTGSASGGNRFAGYISVLKNNLSPFANRALLPIILLALIIIAVFAIKYGFKKYVKNLKESIPLLLMSLTPFIWWFVTSNHSEEHGVFTCRIFAVSVFAIMLFFLKAFDCSDKEK